MAVDQALRARGVGAAAHADREKLIDLLGGGQQPRHGRERLGAEILVVKDTTQHDIRGRYHNAIHNGVIFSTLNPPNTTVGDRLNGNYCVPAPRAPCAAPTATTQGIFARSFHSGGVNGLMGDGSVRLISDNVNLTVYQALGTINGGETTGNF